MGKFAEAARLLGASLQADARDLKTHLSLAEALARGAAAALSSSARPATSVAPCCDPESAAAHASASS
ncbi:MAG: hypothetical protein VXY90_06420, partial [Pseudomonadota bacterium]|nr:hypothetical protein [Pseudomonadota bacterium]